MPTLYLMSESKPQQGELPASQVGEQPDGDEAITPCTTAVQTSAKVCYDFSYQRKTITFA